MSPSDDIPPEVRALVSSFIDHAWWIRDGEAATQSCINLIMADRAARTPDAGVLRAVDTQVLTAAGEMDVQEQAQPAWLWHERENGSISYGRWSKAEAAAPYIRADLVLAALTSPAPITKTAIAEHGEPDAGVAEGRDARQQQVAKWCAAAFGADHQSSVPQRGLRFLEEAIEAYQALNGNAETAHKLIDYIFAKEPGKLFQELGGVGVTLLALAAAAGLSADEAERVEIARVLSKPLEHFWARNKVKNDAGFDAIAYPPAAPPQEQPNGK